MNEGPALVLHSGGQDSTTCLLWAFDQPEFTHVDTVTFDYGQRHRVELDQAATILNHIRDRYGFRPGAYLLEVPMLADLAGGALTNASIPVQEHATEDGGNAYAAARGLPSTYIPGRNLILLSAAAALAGKLGAQHLVTGICAMDRAGYPDCRAEFASAMQTTLRVGLDWPELTLHTPCLFASKADTWRLAEEAAGHWGVDLVRDHSHTCYEGERRIMHDWGAGCGECPACLTRQAGWEEYAATRQAA